ncbi:MAG TPA: RNA 2',3'-cyclic phosphodiesterase [Anaerolineales bacterium]|nr:RNA 2',3'-cyclic phosphodiesterase [Anaerolineales bacterium]
MRPDTSQRLFIELTLPSAVVDELGMLLRACRDRVPAGSMRWVAPEGIHLTLRFLGDVPLRRQADLESVLAAVARRAPGLRRLALEGYGAFPGGRAAPRVFFVGLRDVSGTLPALTRGLDDALAEAGWPSEGRPFHPHLTLGRVKEELRPAQMSELRRALAECPRPEALTFEASQLALMRSELARTGSRYSRLFTAAL